MPARHRSDLKRIARDAMLARGLLPELAPAALAQLAAIPGPARSTDGAVTDLRDLPWCSIDNDDSLDLDQLGVAEDLGRQTTRILIAVADVDALVVKGTAIDQHAATNTTSVYVPGHVFPMLPERLSTDLTSLNESSDRLSLVVSYVVGPDGELSEGTVAQAMVRNHAKLTYDGVAAWLGSRAPLPAAAAKVPGLDGQLVLQNQAAMRLRRLRHARGALDLQSLEARAVFTGDEVTGLRAEPPNAARQLIEEFMIAANGVVARFLAERRRPSLRRVVRSPERWSKIVDKAAELGEALPSEPSATALEAFLVKRRAADPLRFPDLSLAIVKLMGAGEYVVELPGQLPVGHFGLAVNDYVHATAPNRRFPDLVTHRLVKAALTDAASPYSDDELASLAHHCSVQEGNAAKVERQVRKSAAALLLERQIGERFDGIITGAADKGTWVRIFEPPVEGRVERGAQGLRVGDKVRVRLLGTNFERGFLDFAREH